MREWVVKSQPEGYEIRDDNGTVIAVIPPGDEAEANADAISRVPEMAHFTRLLAQLAMSGNPYIDLPGPELDRLVEVAGALETDILFYDPRTLSVFAAGKYEVGERYPDYGGGPADPYAYRAAVRDDGERFVFKTYENGEKGALADFWMSRLLRGIRLPQGHIIPALPAQLAHLDSEFGVLYPLITTIDQDRELWKGNDAILCSIGVADREAVIATKAIIVGLTDWDNSALPKFLCSGIDIPFTLNHQDMLFLKGEGWGAPAAPGNRAAANYPDLSQFFPGEHLAPARTFWHSLTGQREKIRRLFYYLTGQFPDEHRATVEAHIEPIIGMLGDPAFFPVE